MYFAVALLGLSVPRALLVPLTPWGVGQSWEFHFHLGFGSFEVFFSSLAHLFDCMGSTLAPGSAPGGHHHLLCLDMRRWFYFLSQP